MPNRCIARRNDSPDGYYFSDVTGQQDYTWNNGQYVLQTITAENCYTFYKGFNGQPLNPQPVNNSFPRAFVQYIPTSQTEADSMLDTAPITAAISDGYDLLMVIGLAVALFLGVLFGRMR